MRILAERGGVGWGGLVLVVSLMLSAAAQAADVESVEALIRQGVELRHQGHDVRALPLFQKAYGMTRTPRTAGQLGLCEMAMGYWLDAESHLGEAVSVPEHPWVAKNLNDLTGAMASVRRNISEVVVEGGPVGAEVLVNGQPVGRLPLASPLRLGKGVADIELRAPGHVAASRSLKVSGGTQERVSIVLAQAQPAAQPPPPALSGTDPAIRPPTDEPHPAPPPPGGDQPKMAPKRIAAWATGAVAGAALIFGVVETVSWASKLDQFDHHKGPLPSNPTITDRVNCGNAEPNYGGPGCQDIHNSLAQARTLTIVGFGLAAALGATSAVLFATSSPDRPKTDTAFTCAPDLARRGVGCVFSF